MPGLVPGIHVFKVSYSKDVDGDKPGHDSFYLLQLRLAFGVFLCEFDLGNGNQDFGARL
jgi:hypothetical protein